MRTLHSAYARSGAVRGRSRDIDKCLFDVTAPAVRGLCSESRQRECDSQAVSKSSDRCHEVLRY